jgi:hypothetical protein
MSRKRVGKPTRFADRKGLSPKTCPRNPPRHHPKDSAEVDLILHRCESAVKSRRIGSRTAMQDIDFPPELNPARYVWTPPRMSNPSCRPAKRSNAPSRGALIEGWDCRNPVELVSESGVEHFDKHMESERFFIPVNASCSRYVSVNASVTARN